MLIKVLEITGDSAITLEAGQTLYALIKEKLDKQEKVELDFSGVEAVATLYFNAAIGQLYKDFSSETLNQLLDIKELIPAGRNILNRVKKNSKTYYDQPEVREAVGSVLGTWVETDN